MDILILFEATYNAFAKSILKYMFIVVFVLRVKLLVLVWKIVIKCWGLVRWSILIEVGGSTGPCFPKFIDGLVLLKANFTCISKLK